MKCYIQPGLNFHPTSLEFAVDDNRDYRDALFDLFPNIDYIEIVY